MEIWVSRFFPHSRVRSFRFLLIYALIYAKALRTLSIHTHLRILRFFFFWQHFCCLFSLISGSLHLLHRLVFVNLLCPWRHRERPRSTVYVQVPRNDRFVQILTVCVLGWHGKWNFQSHFIAFVFLPLSFHPGDCLFIFEVKSTRQLCLVTCLWHVDIVLKAGQDVTTDRSMARLVGFLFRRRKFPSFPSDICTLWCVFLSSKVTEFFFLGRPSSSQSVS